MRAGGPSDKAEGIAHMKALKSLALELGFEVPYYTTTGWGGAIVLDGETIPVLGGYVDAPWAGHVDEMPACENFLFMPFREDENIGADLKIEKEEEITFSKAKNPYLTAELGGGLQVTAHRRTYPFARDIEAQSVCMLGAGANLLGYYMYHGGYNPDGKYSNLQEARVTGYFNDLPVKSYDFQTCIRESGKLNESYHRLKRLHLMIHAFSETLAQAQAYFPDIQPENAEDMTTPRISVRYCHETQEGFLFINNHQRLRRMEPIKDLQVEIYGIGKEPLILEHICCDSGECAVIPFGLQMGKCRLLRTNVSLLTKIGERYFFYENGGNPYFDYEGEAYDNIVILSKEEAEYVYQFGDRLYITKKPLFEQDGILYMLTNVSVSYTEYSGEEKQKMIDVTNQVHAEDRSLGADEHCEVYHISLSMQKDEEDKLHEIYLHMDYAGDKAELYDGDRILTDWFSNGEEWIVALKRYGYPRELSLVVYPYKEGVYYDLPPKKGCELLSASVEQEQKTQV
ncbi:MAG: beta-galactosidase [Lachnospiraceae bacterium]|nr:beta-galactosidase [Lachnospiraceae bacterium]